MFTGFVNLKENTQNLKEYIYSMTNILKKSESTELRIFF